MSDDKLRALASEAGIAVDWTDARGECRHVSAGSLRAMLATLGMDCATDPQISDSRDRLAKERRQTALAPLITATVGEPVRLPAATPRGARALVEFEHGGASDRIVDHDAGGAWIHPISRIGYHRLIIGGQAVTLAVAPARCWSVGDVAPGERLWGLTAQIGGLRRNQDGGAGDFGAVAQLARSAARHRADALSLGPTHALFAADDNHFTPYSPSSRLFHNAMLADPGDTFDAARVAQARAGLDAEMAALEGPGLIDWPRAARARKAMLRALFDDFRERELPQKGNALAADFARFRQAGGQALGLHGAFEALHTQQFSRDPSKWHWRTWPGELRDRGSETVKSFIVANSVDVVFHIFMQWLAERSLARAQSEALSAGMRIGLVSDIAVGMNDGGSQAWSSPEHLLLGLSIGAPPDPLAPLGQNWGLTTFSPRALASTGYWPFLATLRVALRHAGGARIDHVMGLSRLWLTPDGMDASQGAYLAYPESDLLKLIALESARHRAIMIGEDLGVVPDGLRDRLAAANILGTRVVQFERHSGGFNAPDWYPANTVAMTSTHDTATIAGWWRGLDLATRSEVGHLPPGQSLAAAARAREGERSALWDEFKRAGVAHGEAPAAGATSAVADAATGFLARAQSCLALLPLEDALGLDEQPNLPGTTTEHPNWRRRYPQPADACLAADDVTRRLAPLAERR